MPLKRLLPEILACILGPFILVCTVVTKLFHILKGEVILFSPLIEKSLYSYLTGVFEVYICLQQHCPQE
jgi:hypothetical protein